MIGENLIKIDDSNMTFGCFSLCTQCTFQVRRRIATAKFGTVHKDMTKLFFLLLFFHKQFFHILFGQSDRHTKIFVGFKNLQLLFNFILTVMFCEATPV